MSENKTKWIIDPSHSLVEFSVKHLGIAWVQGRFTKVSGEAEFDQESLEGGSFKAEVETESVTTFDEKRDQHLKTADFFDVENHPKATFKGSEVKKLSDKEYEVSGDLTIRGITKPVIWKVEYSGTGEMPLEEGKTQTRAGMSAKATINRHDFKISWDAPVGEGKTMVASEVEIALQVEFIKQ